MSQFRFLLFILVFGFGCVKAQVSPAEKQALLDFYNATNGPSWVSENDSDVTNDWDFTGNVTDDWHGIQLTNGHVTRLNLSSNGLLGALPNNIDDLAFLERLYLNSNQLSGTLPSELGNLSNLTHLHLYINSFTGNIPPELGNLGQLEQLTLYVNQLSGSIPSSLGNLGNLTHLYLNSNSLTGPLPVELGNITGLRIMSLGSNQLTGTIPPEYGNFTNIWQFFVAANNLSGTIPVELGNLQSLGYLSLAQNNFTGPIPTGLGNLTNLLNLNLEGNQLSGSIPTELGNLSNLEWLELGENNLTGTIPSSLGNLLNLQYLRMESNSITGGIPSTLGALTNLRELIVQNNELSGALPAELGNLNALVQLNLSNNSLQGDVPNGVSQFPNLSVFWLTNNNFEFGNLEYTFQNSQNFNFYYNPQKNTDEEQSLTVEEGSAITLSTNVSGTQNNYQWYKDGSAIPGAPNAADYTISNATPDDIGTYHCIITSDIITNLTLRRNDITLDVTASSCGVSAAEKQALLDLYNSTNGDNWTNTLAGNQPWDTNTPVCDWFGVTVVNGEVTSVDLDRNSLTGTIPNSIGDLIHVTYLELAHNDLTGSLPNSIGNMASLTTLFLELNQLSGNIPTTIGNLSNLVQLKMGNNALTGPIPTEIGNLSNLNRLNLNQNNLSGTLPPELANLSNLIFMYLTGNQLTGNIPPTYGNLTNLRYFWLSGNQLTGNIPPELGNMTSAIDFHVDGNLLTGTIPPELGNLLSLDRIRLDRNQLTGTIPAEFGNFSVIRTILVNDNLLSGNIPAELGQLSNLVTLHLHENQLTGTIPIALGLLSNLKNLLLSQNQLAGAIPIELAQLPALQGLSLNDNQLSGDIPSQFSTNATLSLFNFINNNFVFSNFESEHLAYSSNLSSYNYFPQANVDETETIVVAENGGITLTSTALTSTNNSYQWYKDGIEIPGATTKDLIISNATATDAGTYYFTATNSVVSGLTLTRNDITLEVLGNPCVSAGEKQALLDLYNATNGPNWGTPWDTVNGEPCDWYGVTVVDGKVTSLILNGNDLSGTLPNSLGNLIHLEFLNLSFNQITGAIPTEIGQLANLEDIYLSSNQLTGNIPVQITQLSNLRRLYLTNNQLTGVIPTEIGQLTNLLSLFLNYNQLTGNIPETMGQLTNLRQLFLNNNQLTGNIPVGFSQLNLSGPAFLSISVASNQLSGRIPPELTNINNPSRLQFNDNGFVYADFETEHSFYTSNVTTYSFSPQAKVDDVLNLEAIIGGTAILSSNSLTSPNNSYQWYKDGVLIPGATDKDLMINMLTEADAGVYHFTATNSVVTGLTLTRNDVILTVVPDDGNSNPGNPGGAGSTDETGWNIITSWNMDLEGNIKSNARAYFDCLGKQVQTQNWDLATNTIWGQVTKYDYQGRAAFSSLSAPINGQSNFQYYDRFVTNDSNNIYSEIDFDGADPYNPGIVGNSEPLGQYYSGQTSDTYQDVTQYPFSRTIFSTLNPGQPLAAVGGNKMDTDADGDVDGQDTWPQGYSFSMQASSELSRPQAFDDNAYTFIQTQKTVTRDIHGHENVVFTDTDGKVLGAARSGPDGTNSGPLQLSIKEQGFVDVHVPVGITGFSVNRPEEVTIYDLITEQPVGDAGSLGNGFYRVAANNPGAYLPSFPIIVTYEVNYYDYSLNEYDEADRLKATYQPLTDANGDRLVTTYEYDALGQLTKVVSPDEGTAEFKYREDGQIRFSRNSKQKNQTTFIDEYSYTNYDDRGRPIASGVAQIIAQPGNPNILVFESLDPDTDYNFEITTENQYTRYDDLGSFLGYLQSNTSPEYHNPSFLAGNVAMTRNNTSSTFYSYDVYGRVAWVVQEISGLGFKTLDYTYHPLTGLVEKVIYQKGAADQFIHRYAYNVRDQLTTVETSVDDSLYLLQAQYFYNEAGTLVRTELADGAQGMDYVYNLSGQLKSINHPSLQASNDPRRNNAPGDTNDLFGMQIDYYTGDYQRNSPNITTSDYGTDRFNGNIKGIRWGTAIPQNTGQEIEYVYSYDRNNWLTGADFDPSGSAIGSGGLLANDESNAVFGNGESATLEATQSFTLKLGFHAQSGSAVTVRINSTGGGIMNGDYDVSNITYDANGNIQTLKRNKGSQNGNNAMDDLNYNYDPNKPNQLAQLVDSAGDVAQAEDIGSQTDPENYVYNAIGELVENKEESITYSYDASGLVTQVNRDGQPAVKFFYNASNHRVKKESYNSGSLQNTTYYVRDVAGQVMAIYNDNSGSPEVVERPVYGGDRIGVGYGTASNDTDFVYELTDHLGNVRALFMKSGTDANLEGYTDYYPFGMSMPGRNLQDANQYRYAFQGQEKDPETDKEAFELRLWDSRIGRWLSPDPYGQFDSPYLGMGNNPTNIVDPDGGFACIDPDTGAAIPCPDNLRQFEGPTNIDAIVNKQGELLGYQHRLEEVTLTADFVPRDKRGDFFAVAGLVTATLENFNIGQLKKSGKLKVYRAFGSRPFTGNASTKVFKLSNYAKIGGNILTAAEIGGDIYDVLTTEGAEQEQEFYGLLGTTGGAVIGYYHPVIGIILTGSDLISQTQWYHQQEQIVKERQMRERVERGELGVTLPWDPNAVFRQARN